MDRGEFIKDGYAVRAAEGASWIVEKRGPNMGMIEPLRAFSNYRDLMAWLSEEHRALAGADMQGKEYWDEAVKRGPGAKPATIGDVARKHVQKLNIDQITAEPEPIGLGFNTQDQGMVEIPDAYATAGRDVTRDVAGFALDNTVNPDGIRKDSPMAKTLADKVAKLRNLLSDEGMLHALTIDGRRSLLIISENNDKPTVYDMLPGQHMPLHPHPMTNYYEVRGHFRVRHNGPHAFDFEAIDPQDCEPIQGDGWVPCGGKPAPDGWFDIRTTNGTVYAKVQGHNGWWQEPAVHQGDVVAYRERRK